MAVITKICKFTSFKIMLCKKSYVKKLCNLQFTNDQNCIVTVLQIPNVNLQFLMLNILQVI